MAPPAAQDGKRRATIERPEPGVVRITQTDPFGYVCIYTYTKIEDGQYTWGLELRVPEGLRIPGVDPVDGVIRE